MNSRNITGIILAGGEGRRMGGTDKGQSLFNGIPLIEHVLTALKPQVNDIVISANRNKRHYEVYGFPVVSDLANSEINGDTTQALSFQGPIAGIIAGMEAIETELAVIVPCDTPLMSHDLVPTLLNQYQDSPTKLTLFDVEGRLQPLFGLYHVSLLEDLKTYFNDGHRKLARWCEQQNPKIIKYQGRSDVFTNINTLEALKKLEQA